MPITTARLAMRADPNTVLGAEAANSPLLGFLRTAGPRENGTNAVSQTIEGVTDWVRGRLGGNSAGGGNSLVLNFPYTPVIRTGTEAMYTEMELTHTNYQPHAFNRSQIQNISIQAKFTSQTDLWAKHSLAVIHFLRTITKMRYGAGDPLRGAPPPVLSFTAYGRYMFENVPVVVKSFNITLPDDVDYAELNVAGQYHAVPTLFTVDIELMVQRAVGPIKDEFTLGKFAGGQLAEKGYI